MVFACDLEYQVESAIHSWIHKAEKGGAIWAQDISGKKKKSIDFQKSLEKSRISIG